jgi:hypothetical protein
MKKRQLGNTELYVSEIGLGCASYWGKKQFDRTQAINVVQESVVTENYTKTFHQNGLERAAFLA